MACRLSPCPWHTVCLPAHEPPPPVELAFFVGGKNIEQMSRDELLGVVRGLLKGPPGPFR